MERADIIDLLRPKPALAGFLFKYILMRSPFSSDIQVRCSPGGLVYYMITLAIEGGTSFFAR